MTDTDHSPKRVGPGVPACACGEFFEWDHERADHINRHRRDEEKHAGK